MANWNNGTAIGLRLLLLRDYFYANSSKTRSLQRQQIEDYLREKGYSAERKTVYRDIALLRDMFGLELEFSKAANGYLLKNPPYEPHELRLIVDGIQASKFITAEQAKRLTRKIQNLTDIETAATLNRQAHVDDRIRNSDESVMKHTDRIHQAIAENRKIGFRYFHFTPDKSNPKSYSKNGKRYVVSPYSLKWSNGNYYLYAYDSEEQKFRHFRVDRMEDIREPLPLPRDGKEQYEQQQNIVQKAKVFDMYNGEAYDVQMRVHNRIASSVIDTFGKDVMMIPDDKDHFITTVPVEISPPFFAWVATFGRSVKILSPEPVIEKMKEFLNKSLDMYKEDGKM